MTNNHDKDVEDYVSYICLLKKTSENFFEIQKEKMENINSVLKPLISAKVSLFKDETVIYKLIKDFNCYEYLRKKKKRDEEFNSFNINN
jgi:hypothetical protein